MHLRTPYNGASLQAACGSPFLLFVPFLVPILLIDRRYILASQWSHRRMWHQERLPSPFTPFPSAKNESLWQGKWWRHYDDDGDYWAQKDMLSWDFSRKKPTSQFLLHTSVDVNYIGEGLI